MRKITGTGLAALVAALGAVACEAADRDTDMDAPPAAEAPAEAPAGDAPGTGTEGAATIGVATLDDGGSYLTDGSGRTLYLLEGDSRDGSTCYDECAEEWPPFLARQGAPRAGAGEVREDLIGTLERRDGGTQVTYAGHPLYYYHDDEEPGDLEGQHVEDEWGQWHLVQPGGNPVEGHGDHG